MELGKRRQSISSITCSSCSMNPLVGIRYKCSTCQDYDLCSECLEQLEEKVEDAFHPQSHVFLRLCRPVTTDHPPLDKFSSTSKLRSGGRGKLKLKIPAPSPVPAPESATGLRWSSSPMPDPEKSGSGRLLSGERIEEEQRENLNRLLRSVFPVEKKARTGETSNPEQLKRGRGIAFLQGKTFMLHPTSGQNKFKGENY